MMKNNNYILLLTIVVCLLSQCKVGNRQSIVEDVLPLEPNYGDTTQWYVTDRNNGVDVFYVISTETGDYLNADGVLFHYADTYNDSVRGPMYGEMLGVDTLLSGKLNYYSPYYRQCSLQSFANDSLLEARFPVSLGDVKKAFIYYLTHINNGRPFILAGFSQGARIMLELMKDMDENTYRRMVAAYAIGINIPQEMVDECSNIVPALQAGDLGVTICYNSVSENIGTNAAIFKRSAIAINPVNWRTDETKASFMTEPSPWLLVSEQKKDTLTVHLDMESNLLFVGGYTATDYMLPLIGKEGNYHTREIWLYRDFLRENMALRAAKYMKRLGRNM